MAKRVRKTRKAPRRRTASPRRITTRRLGPARTRSGSPARGVRSRAARSRGETLQVTLDLRDVSNRPVRDPETYFTFRRVSDRRQIGDQIRFPARRQAILVTSRDGAQMSVIRVLVLQSADGGPECRPFSSR